MLILGHMLLCFWRGEGGGVNLRGHIVKCMFHDCLEFYKVSVSMKVYMVAGGVIPWEGTISMCEGRICAGYKGYRSF